MPRVRCVRDCHFGNKGFVFDIDDDAVRHALYEEKVLEIVSNDTPSAVVDAIEPETGNPIVIDVKCSVCGFVAKNSTGLAVHKRKHL